MMLGQHNSISAALNLFSSPEEQEAVARWIARDKPEKTALDRSEELVRKVEKFGAILAKQASQLVFSLTITSRCKSGKWSIFCKNKEVLTKESLHKIIKQHITTKYDSVQLDQTFISHFTKAVDAILAQKRRAAIKWRKAFVKKNKRTTRSDLSVSPHNDLQQLQAAQQFNQEALQYVARFEEFLWLMRVEAASNRLQTLTELLLVRLIDLESKNLQRLLASIEGVRT